MTTIATDGHVMAGDGLTHACEVITSHTMRKVHRLNDGRIYGGCGAVEDMLAVRDWLNAGGDTPMVGDDFGAILIGPDGVQWADNTLYFHAVDAPAAIGSGMPIALGAMEAGASPAHAVGIAARRDPFTGGDIFVEALG